MVVVGVEVVVMVVVVVKGWRWGWPRPRLNERRMGGEWEVNGGGGRALSSRPLND